VCLTRILNFLIILTTIFFSNLILVSQSTYSQEDNSSPVTSNNTSNSTNNDGTGYILISLIVIAFIYLIYSKLRRRYGKHRERRYFPTSVKLDTKRKQQNKCAICKKNAAGIWQFDHKDGNRTNNSPNNCQALCPNCHAKKTYGPLKQEPKNKFSFQKLILASIVILIILFFVSR
jgi:hypothetical protein